MPNWCECDLIISGDEETIQKFIDAITTDDGLSILPTQHPMPEELSGIISSVKVVETEAEAEEINAEYNAGEASIGALPQRTHDELVEKYGATNWYDWNIKNWGSKWGDCRTTIGQRFDGEVTINFESPWSPPNEGLLFVSKKWTDLTFSMKFYEMGAGYCGEFECKNGNTVAETLEDYNGNRGG